MSFRMSRLVAVLALSSAVAGTVQAQGGAMHLGPRLSYQFDLEEFGIGAQLSAPIARNLEFYPSFDYFFVDPGSFWNLNADLKYRIATENINWLYLGAGLNIARSSFNGNGSTDAGINAFVGAESRAGRIHPFAEFRFTSNDGSTGQLSVGLNFTLRQ
ncbi:MAG: hypothetical protein ABR551_01390 [Gemmatimonadales bacterium]